MLQIHSFIHLLRIGVGNHDSERKGLKLLSRNILRGHSSTDKDMSTEWVRAGIVVKINSLAKGKLDVSLKTIEFLVALLNKDIIPVVSLSMHSGDVCFLAQIGLIISKPVLETDKGEVICNGIRMSASEAFAQAGLERIVFGHEESLAIACGRSISLGVACIAYSQANRLYKQTLGAFALSMEAMMDCPHADDSEAQKALANLLETSQLIASSPKDDFTPQIEGVLYQRLDEMRAMLNLEIARLASILWQGCESLRLAVKNVAMSSERRLIRILDATWFGQDYQIVQDTATAYVQRCQKATPLSTHCNQGAHLSFCFLSFFWILLFFSHCALFFRRCQLFRSCLLPRGRY